jgi:glutaredoxin
MKPKPHVRFYTKPGCHLCAEARREVERAGCADLYTFEEVNILSDPELHRRYAYDIPVVVINGTHAFKHHVNADEFRRAIAECGTGDADKSRPE